ncbi:hypothetical protein THAOC_06885, partial [Thalassiosira oceanica]
LSTNTLKKPRGSLDVHFWLADLTHVTRIDATRQDEVKKGTTHRQSSKGPISDLRSSQKSLYMWSPFLGFLGVESSSTTVHHTEQTKEYLGEYWEFDKFDNV